MCEKSLSKHWTKEFLQTAELHWNCQEKNVGYNNIFSQPTQYSLICFLRTVEFCPIQGTQQWWPSKSHIFHYFLLPAVLALAARQIDCPLPTLLSSALTKHMHYFHLGAQSHYEVWMLTSLSHSIPLLPPLWFVTTKHSKATMSGWDGREKKKQEIC